MTGGVGKFLILGGTGGIGSALASRLVRRGYKVHLLARSADKLSSLAKSLPGATAGSEVGYSEVDVTNTEAVEAAIKKIGRLSGLAYCVGSINLKPLKACSPDDFVKAFKLNTVGAAVATKAALPGLLEEAKATGIAGSVVFFSSVAVRQGFTNHAIISVSKGGVEGLTRSLAAELAPHIRVNAVAPSLTDTPLASALTKSNTLKEAVAKAHPIPRLGTGDDAAAAAAYLLDPKDSSWVTGQVIGVDGGRSSLAK